jgi:WD40 repeat protein
MSTELPIDASVTHRKQPWLLHTLNIPTVNFCSFASCIIPHSVATETRGEQTDDFKVEANDTESHVNSSQALSAVSGLHDSTIDLYALPSEKKVGSIPAPTIINTKTGMVMSLKLFFHNISDLYVIAGYESGRTYVFKRVMPEQRFEAIYTSIPHAQPIMSLDFSQNLEFYVTSSADAIVAKHPLLSKVKQDTPLKVVQTRHAGQQGLKVRSDSRIFATAGWDCRIRVYSAKSMKELAVLKWHKEGCYAVAFAEIDPGGDEGLPGGPSELARTDIGVIQPSTRQAREDKASKTHWLAAGAKDGKVSLWDIY